MNENGKRGLMAGGREAVGRGGRGGECGLGRVGSKDKGGGAWSARKKQEKRELVKKRVKRDSLEMGGPV